MTNSLKHSLSSEANSRSAAQEIYRLPCDPNFRNRVLNIPPMTIFLSHKNPHLNLIPHFFKFHLMLTHLRPGLPIGLLTLGFPYEKNKSCLCAELIQHHTTMAYGGVVV
jgi:hypothetical protein